MMENMNNILSPISQGTPSIGRPSIPINASGVTSRSYVQGTTENSKSQGYMINGEQVQVEQVILDNFNLRTQIADIKKQLQEINSNMSQMKNDIEILKKENEGLRQHNQSLVLFIEKNLKNK